MRDSDPEVDIVQTIRNNYEGYVNKGVKRYILYLKVQTITGHPYEDNCKEMLSNKVLEFCRAKLVGINNVHATCGPGLEGF